MSLEKGVKMRRLLVLIGAVAGLVPAIALAQMSGGLSAPTPDIRNSDLSMHDSAPDLHDQLLKYRERERSDKIRAQSHNGGPSRPAHKDELTTGAVINDKTGAAIAKIDQVDADGVVVYNGVAKVKVPAAAFGHNKAGLLLDMTKADFEQVVASANAH
jgi:hypothetical protein